MKKWLLVLGMITCIFGMTACGNKQEEQSDPMVTEESAFQYGEQMVEGLNEICNQGLESQIAGDPVLSSAAGNWKKAGEDMGNYVKIIDRSADISSKGVVIDLTVQGSRRNANVQVVLDKELQLTSIATNVEYTFGELMEKAGLNTILGMGTVFSILILISIIIYLMRYIPRLVGLFSKKSKADQAAAVSVAREEAVDNTIAQIIEKEEMSDDLELVAVITAAIAAGGEAAGAPSDGFVVRSIRRADRRKWQQA